MANDLDRSERTVKTALRELENAGLITRVRQGWNQANRIFLQIPDGVQFSSRPEGNICPMDGQDSSPRIGQELPTSNTEQEYKDKSQTEKAERTRRRYGEFENVFLSDGEISALQADFPNQYDEYIQRLSRYICRLFIAIGWSCTNKLTRFHALALLRFYLAADVKGIGFIYHILQR